MIYSFSNNVVINSFREPRSTYCNVLANLKWTLNWITIFFIIASDCCFFVNAGKDKLYKWLQEFPTGLIVFFSENTNYHQWNIQLTFEWKCCSGSNFFFFFFWWQKRIYLFIIIYFSWIFFMLNCIFFYKIRGQHPLFMFLGCVLHIQQQSIFTCLQQTWLFGNK